MRCLKTVCKSLLESKTKLLPPKHSVKFKCQIQSKNTNKIAEKCLDASSLGISRKRKCLDASSRAQPPLHHCSCSYSLEFFFYLLVPYLLIQFNTWLELSSICVQFNSFFIVIYVSLLVSALSGPTWKTCKKIQPFSYRFTQPVKRVVSNSIQGYLVCLTSVTSS